MFPDEMTRSSANEEAEVLSPDASSHYDQSVTAGVFRVWTSGPPGPQEEVLLPL